MRRTFHPLRVVDIRRETDDSVSLGLEVPADLAESFRFRAGQFLTFRVEGPGGEPIDRVYSICSVPADRELRVLVKRLPGGVFGEHVHTALRTGDVLATATPLGRFTTAVDPTRRRAYLALVAGSGISPVMSLLRTILEVEPESRVTLVYGNRGTNTVIFRDALADLKDRYLDRVQLIYVFSRESQATTLLNGRLTPPKLRELAAHLLDLPSYDEVFVCGPQPMTLDLRQALIDLGRSADTIHVELFGTHGTAAPHAPVALGAAGEVELEIVLGGIRRTIVGTGDSTVLATARAAGLDVPFSCTGGVCATCRARLVDGTVAMAANYALQAWELEAGFVLTCQSVPTSARLVVDYDAV